MKKQTKQLILLLAALLVLVAAYFGLQKYNEKQAAKPIDTGVYTVVDEVKEDVVRISYIHDGETLLFELVDGTWYYAEDHSIPLNQRRIKTMAERIAPLQVYQEIADVTDMAQYGLTEPVNQVYFETAKGKYQFDIGAYNDVTKSYYIRLNSENKVYVVGAAAVTLFNASLDELIEEPEEK